MSRMEKYHGKHEKEKGVKTPATEIEVAEEVIAKQPKQPKQSKKNKKRRKPLLKTIVILGLLIFIGIADPFFLGYLSAKTDSQVKAISVSDFHGVAPADGSVNVLLLGSDSRGEELGRADSIMVAHYDKKSKKPKIISFMRDTYVTIPGQGQNKLNAAYAFGGPELVRQTLKESFGLDCQYYAVVNFSAFSNIIDALLPKGLLINVEKDMTVDGDTLTAGWQHLNGHEALQYARFRKDAESDFGRVRRQQQVMNALVDQSLTFRGSIHFPKAFGKAIGYTTTNIPTTLLPSLIVDSVFGRVHSIEKLSVPVENSWWDNNYPGVGSVLEIDQEMNTTAITNFLNS